METAQPKTVNRAATTSPAPAAHPVAQSPLRVSSPKDSAEVEAESTAKKVMRMGAPEPTVMASGGEASVQRKSALDEKLGDGPRRGMKSPHVARFAEAVGMMQRKAEGQPNVASNVAADIANSSSSGAPLPLSVRRFMEPRFKADFSGVRIHTGSKAAQLSRQLNAQAFTVGNQIYFGKDRYRPDSADGQELIAHELTHTIQQGAAPQQATVHRSEDVTVTQQSAPQVQRLGISDALDYFADKAYNIPGFRMFTIILGVNPINMSRVDRSAANILRAIVEFIPGGNLITQALDNHGVFEKVGAWVEQQISSLGMTGRLIKDGIDRFLDSLSWSDIFDLGGVWERAKRIFTEPIDRIISFGKGLITGIIKFIKDAILRPLGRLAEGTRGYDLLKAILGEDPVTGDPVPRNADTLIGGFMKLIGQEEVWNNLKQSNAVARAWAWFQGAMGALMGFVREIPGLFVRAFTSLELMDIVLLPRAFSKVGAVFGGFIGRFISWAGEAVWNLLEIIFAVVAPGVMPYLKKAAATFRTILRNPIGFIGNLVRAGIMGFRQFSTNFLTHLRASLVGWITGAMGGAGIYIPQGLTLPEILKFVLSVLGLTWQNIRQKLVRAVGEPAVRAMETAFDLVVTLVTQGPAAAWQKILESLTNLRDMVMEQIMTFVKDRVVQAAITRLLTSLNPAGAFIQAIIAIYNTVMFFVERLRQISQVAASFIDSLAAIASGALAPAASRVERTMAGMLTLVISFLARIAGLGRVSDAVTGVINRVRQPIDRGLDRVVEWIVAQARRLGRFIAQAGLPQDPAERLRLGMAAAVTAVNRFAGRRVGGAVLTPLLTAIRMRYGFQTLTVVAAGRRWDVQGQVNPTARQNTNALNETVPAGEAFRYRIKTEPGVVQTARVGQSRGGQLSGPASARSPRGYIGNTPVSLGGPQPASIATQYLSAFGSPQEAGQRFSLVVAVNAVDDLAGRNVAEVTRRASGGAGAAYPWAVFGLMWRPRWADRETGAEAASVADVRRVYNDAQLTPPASRTAAEAEEARNRSNAAIIPYGALRTQLLQAGETSSFRAGLLRRADTVFVHVSDPDTVNFNPAREGAGAGGNEALFQRFDRILNAMVRDVGPRSRRGRRQSDGGAPIVATGGYEFELRMDPPLTGQTADLRTRLSGQLDMAVRQAMASVDPRSVYFPEPNLLIQLTPQTLRASFGPGRYESRRVIASIEANGARPELVFDLRGSVATGAQRFEVSVEGTSLRSTWGQMDDVSDAELRAMLTSAQSHAHQFVWARQIAASYRLPPQTALNPLNALWARYFPVSSLLCGYSVRSLKRNVVGDQFTSMSAYGQAADIRQQLLNSISRGQPPTAEQQQLADRIVEIARQGGLALGRALAEMFRRSSSGG
ncbi:hypothetical protein MYSTI_05986 [Myxococcus stipitatus DSM 14675]|uniref:eCIS core domain-containing protein n=1 Tax=Myxococcus stipitatus (strain DSM 14675 / JCM 12634 / Mx s8) TaxID=1278073 RepID=L7ULC5_MYXSD|nr:DUF4157 domain-containing protein [Myxococcus stipitatus]AGC47259.1 hypothetical protein MYSTI_05986 [Myxococcus stipitatus DSM 14675]